MLLEDALVGRAYRVKVEGSDGPWCEGVLTRKYRDEDGMLRGDFPYFEGSPRLPENGDLLELEPIQYD